MTYLKIIYMAQNINIKIISYFQKVFKNWYFDHFEVHLLSYTLVRYLMVKRGMIIRANICLRISVLIRAIKNPSIFSRFSSALFLFLSWGRHLVFEGTNGQTRTTSNVTSINLPPTRIRSNLKDSHDLVSTKITIATFSWLRITKADWIPKGNTGIIENRIHKISWKSATL